MKRQRVRALKSYASKKKFKKDLKRNQLMRPNVNYSFKSFSPTYVSGPLPNSLQAKMRYSTNFSLNVGVAGVADTRVFSANGLYDPDITGVGNQPRGFDQLMTMYDHYIVTASKITVWSSIQTAESNDQFTHILPRDSNSAFTTPDDIFEYRYHVTKLLGRGGDADHSPLKCYMKIGQFLGGRDPLTDPDLKGTSAANPVEQAFWHVAASSIALADTNGQTLRVIIDYDVLFVEPKQPTQS